MTDDWAIYRYEGQGRMRFVTRLTASKSEIDRVLSTMAEEHGETLFARPYYGSARPPQDLLTRRTDQLDRMTTFVIYAKAVIAEARNYIDITTLASEHSEFVTLYIENALADGWHASDAGFRLAMNLKAKLERREDRSA